MRVAVDIPVKVFEGLRQSSRQRGLPLEQPVTAALRWRRPSRCSRQPPRNNRTIRAETIVLGISTIFAFPDIRWTRFSLEHVAEQLEAKMSVDLARGTTSSLDELLNRITVEGLTSFDRVDVDLGRLTLLVGPNGAGKSNFIGAFELLGAIQRQELSSYVTRAGGANALLHRGESRADHIRIEAHFESNAYEVILEPTADDDLFFSSEIAKFQGPGRKRPFTESLGSGHRESKLRGWGSGVPGWVDRVIQNWVVYHFHDTSRRSPMKATGDIGNNERLQADGSNLAALLYRMSEARDPDYGRIVDAIRLVAPFFDDFDLRPDPVNDSLIRLEWTQRSSTSIFGPDTLSDGTLRFICIATLLLQPKPPSLILLDEPELGLHPFAIHQVADMLASSDRQIILSTQSVTLLNQMAIDDVLVAENQGGHTTLQRPSLDGLEEWLEIYSVGEMWEKSFLGGRPR